MALVRPDLFTYKTGVVRVETQGLTVGHTLLDQGLKKCVVTYFLYLQMCFLDVGMMTFCYFGAGGMEAIHGQDIPLLK